WIYRDDYRRGGLVMLGVDDEDGRRTGRMALLYAAALLPVSLLPSLLGVTGAWYFFGALALGIAYAAVGATLVRGATAKQAWRLFVASIIYLPSLLTLMVLDKVAGWFRSTSCSSPTRSAYARLLPCGRCGATPSA